MGEQKPRNVSAPPYPSPWRVPVTLDDIPETGQHFELDADAGVRAAVAKVAGLRDLPRLHASFDVTRRGADGLHVSGSVSATVGQTCIVTLEPLANQVAETIDLAFIPQHAPEPSGDADEKREPRDVRWDDPEPLPITFPGSVGECRSESVCITHGFRPGMPAWLPYGI